ncbi:MAG TPA: hypothetical protein VI873_01600 [Candidatus Peribacteraceae bacterium]|nr:hypothetical protein [Candidatus Peribacteraceae bacterium]
MADSSTPSQGTGSSLTIPDEVKAKYPELVALILGSESMNDEERQYWINILPIMTPEQVTDLRGILDNEKKQLQAIDQKYAGDIEKMGKTEVRQQTDDERRQRRLERATQEQAHAEEMGQNADELLKEIEQS